MNKVYEITVVLHVYGQNSKEAAKEFVEETLSVDGLITEKLSKPVLMKPENNSKEELAA